MLKLKNTLKILDVILTMWWYYVIFENRNNLERTKLTLHVVTNKDGFSNGSEVGEEGDIVSNLYLGGFIYHNSVNWIFPKGSLHSQCFTGKHAEGTKYNWTALEFRELPRKFTTGDSVGSKGGI